MNGVFAGVVDKIFSTGVPAYIDLQEAKARNYRPNDPTPAVQTPSGASSPAGQAALSGFAASIPGGVTTLVLAGVALVAVVIVLARR